MTCLLFYLNFIVNIYSVILHDYFCVQILDLRYYIEKIAMTLKEKLIVGKKSLKIQHVCNKEVGRGVFMKNQFSHFLTLLITSK